MTKGIRAQLFFGFGGLVLVISLFYSRLMFVFFDVTQDLVGDFIITHKLDNVPTTPPEVESLNAFLQQPVTLVSRTTMDELATLEPLVHDETRFKFSLADSKGYAARLPQHEKEVWLLVNLDKETSIANFSSVLGVFLGSISVAVIILSVLSTWFIASRLSLPIRNLTNAVAQQQRDQDCVMHEASRQDEIGQLALAFEDTYGELQHAWRREHDFASDVSHELRTPVALIKNTLELNTTDKLSGEDRLLLDQSTATLQSTIEVLLALARKENLVFEHMRLLPILERVALAILHIHPEQAFDVDIDIQADTQVFGNANLISLLCQNLINNGFYHGNGRK